jgi:cytochrome c biogenesis protein
MRFAVSMLSVLGIASIIGTVLKQNEPYENYIIKFGQFWFEVFEKLGLYDVYHALWFLLILLFLVISTSLCIYRNTPLMLKEWRVFKEHATEKSLRAFSHQITLNASGALDLNQSKISQYLTGQGYAYKTAPQENGDVLLAAKIGTHQRLGYILTHSAIVIICFGGILDGNLPFKIQEMLGHKKIEVLDIPSSQVPAVSRLGTNNPSFRANMTLPEGTSASVAFVRVRDGYLVQDLPFRVALKDFRIEHYATGQPKSFESDVVIIDPEVKEPIEKTISVNHPFIYKGIAIYQSDFQDGGSTLNFNVWDMATPNAQSYKVDGVVAKKGTLGQGNAQLTVEFNEFRKFNIINLSPDGKGKPHNVGPNTTYKLRDTAGQAREYVTYMQPLKLDGKAYFVSGMRETVQEDFKYLRIPADDDFSIDGFMYLRSYMMNPAHFEMIAKRLSEKSVSKDDKLQKQFESSIIRLLETFKADGFTGLSKIIESAVPEKDRQNAADAYFKLLSAATFEAYNLSLAERQKPAAALDADAFAFLQDSLNAMNDYFYYGTPYYFQLQDFVHKEASGLQLTKSPGQKWVYLGSTLLVLGIFAMFYIRERRVWILLKADSPQVLLAMSSNRKNLDFEQDFDRIRNQLTQVLS